MITFDWFTIEKRRESCTRIHNSLYNIPFGPAESWEGFGFHIILQTHAKCVSNE